MSGQDVPRCASEHSIDWSGGWVGSGCATTPQRRPESAASAACSCGWTYGGDGSQLGGGRHIGGCDDDACEAAKSAGLAVARTSASLSGALLLAGKRGRARPVRPPCFGTMQASCPPPGLRLAQTANKRGQIQTSCHVVLVAQIRCRDLGPGLSPWVCV